MNNVVYPLGHDTTELERLDTQAELLHDPLLEKLAKNAKSVLEIGCGNGSNYLLLRNANPGIKYTGIDISEPAIDAAVTRYGSDSKTEFKVMNAAAIDAELEEGAYDLVFTRLVLWSLGSKWQQILQKAHKLLTSGGTFYAFEPCNHLVEMFPAKPAAKQWMDAWDQAAIKSGLNPFIGTEVAAALKKTGFSQVDAKFFPVIASGAEKERYQAIIGNLKGFYMGPAVETLGMSAPAELRQQAISELDTYNSESLVMDALFVSWGRK